MQQNTHEMKPSGYLQGQANLKTGKVARYYYNTQTKVTFEDPLNTQTYENEKSLLNQRVRENTQVLPLDHQDQTHRNSQGASTPKITKYHPEGCISQHNDRLNLPPLLMYSTPQLPLQEDPY